MKSFFITLLLFLISLATIAGQSPYIGQESNEIKSLSSNEVSALLQGMGMGFAKAAELNQYPGPRHVLDLAEQLQLSDQQLIQTNQVFESMRKQAIQFGTQLVEYEKELDSLFSSKQISRIDLDTMLLKIGETRARLRGTHLQAHLEMRKILSHHQVVMYDNLRGYSGGSEQHSHSH